MVMLSIVVCFFLSHLLIFYGLVHSCPNEFQCQSLTLSFPFSNINKPNCGLLLVDCDSDRYPVIQIQPGGIWRILNHSENTTWIVPFFNDDCNLFNNITLPENNTAISLSTTLPKVTMLKCNTNSSNQNSDDLSSYKKFSQCEKEHHFSIYYNQSDGVISDPVGDNYPFGCSSIQWPVGNQTFDPRFEQQLYRLLDVGIAFDWNLHGSCNECYLSGHRCRVDPQNYTCSEEGLTKLGILFIPVIFGIITTFSATAFLLSVLINWRSKKSDHKYIEKLLGPKRYSYCDIKRMTSSFKVKIGQGGFGSVFKGCLIDGSSVAVKLLNNSIGNGEEFINEVASISKTSHVNIVKLLGFCFETNKQALVYEFMPKGSLEKFIFESKSSTSDYQLGIEELFKIVIGVARGLEYLHRLCATRIVHFDVKPHNILLDEDFTPKISDFGLAKSCPQTYDSIISLSAARGTIGYIAPEVVCRYLGSVSHKSDVYSYGMMVLEIVGGRKNVDNGVDNSSQVYMPHWIYNQIGTNQNFNFINTGNDEDDKFARKIIIVSFWCIQTDPSSRPTMTKVVELLESKVESLRIPPRPYLFSSANSPFNQSTPQTQTRLGMDDSFKDSIVTKDDNFDSEIKIDGADDDVILEDPLLLDESVLLRDMNVQEYAKENNTIEL